MTQQIGDVLGETGSPFDGQVPAVDAKYEAFSFTGKRHLLERVAQLAGAVVPKADFSPVLKNFLVTTSAEGLILAATDLELAIIATTPAITCTLPSGKSSIRAVLPAKRLLAILSEAPDTDVTVRVVGDTATVTAGSAEWVLKLSSDGKDFPDTHVTVPEGAYFHPVPRKPLADALRTVRYAVGTSQELAQIAIAPNTKGEMCVTASDRNRFARVLLPGFPVALRVPAVSGTVSEVIRVLDSTEADHVSVADVGQRIVFRTPMVTLMVTKMGKEFPDVEKLILAPVMANQDELILDAAELRAALRRVKIAADDKTSAIAIELANGEATLVARDKARNRATETVKATWAGGERQLVVNHEYLAEMLAANRAPSCTFRLGKDQGKRRSMVLLEDKDAGVTGIISQMTDTRLLGY